jgi:hypothetical protein
MGDDSSPVRVIARPRDGRPSGSAIVRQMLPVIVFVAVALPLLVLAFLAVRKARATGEHPVPASAAEQARIEEEFAAAEAYQEEWREEEKKHHRDTIV